MHPEPEQIIAQLDTLVPGQSASALMPGMRTTFIDGSGLSAARLAVVVIVGSSALTLWVAAIVRSS